MIALSWAVVAIFAGVTLTFVRYAWAGFRERDPLWGIFCLGVAAYAAGGSYAVTQLLPSSPPAMTEVAS